MKRWRTVVAMAVAGLAVAGQARARDLYTAPTSASFGGDTMLCDAANVGKAPVILGIEARSYTGDVVDSSPSTPLGPGQDVSLLVSGIGAAYCKFVVIGNPK